MLHVGPRRIESTGGLSIAAHDLGGTGRPLVFAHATGLHGRVWEPVAAHLRDRFRCWALDLRGHGDADRPVDHDYEWAGFADDVLAAVDALALDRPFGVGHSKGGAALLLAEEARPGTFAGLWCFDPVVFPPEFAASRDRGENPLAAAAARRRRSFASADDAIANYRAKPPFDAVADEALRAYVEHGFTRDDDGITLKCPPEVEAQVYRMGASHGAFEALDRVRCPVTVVRGRVEPGPAAFAERIAAALPAGRLESHPELSHFGPLQAPSIVAHSIIRAFDDR